MTIWYNSTSIATIDFSEYPEKLEDDHYCTELTYEVGLQSSLAENLIK